MGVAAEMCVCSPQKAIVPYSKTNIENKAINLYNSNNNPKNNNIENIKKKKKNSNVAIISNSQTNNDADTYNNVSSNGPAVLTPKTKKESNFSQKKEKSQKSSKDNKFKNIKEPNNVTDKNEEEFEKIDISETILSEINFNEKIKPISKEKKKKIKGRNSLNIVLIGYNEVGKSSFCIRLVNNIFESFYIPSICDEIYCKMMAYNDHNYRINFSVILGGNKIQTQDNILSTADFFLLIYDITKIRSFNQMNIYLKQIKKYLFFYDKDGKNPNFCLIGNKSDLEKERKVTTEIVNKFIEKYNVKHFDMSIKTGNNVNNIIQFFLQIFNKVSFSR